MNEKLKEFLDAKKDAEQYDTGDVPNLSRFTV